MEIEIGRVEVHHLTIAGFGKKITRRGFASPVISWTALIAEIVEEEKYHEVYRA
jgi:hypothetical protein